MAPRAETGGDRVNGSDIRSLLDHVGVPGLAYYEFDNQRFGDSAATPAEPRPARWRQATLAAVAACAVAATAIVLIPPPSPDEGTFTPRGSPAATADLVAGKLRFELSQSSLAEILAKTEP